MTSNSGQHVWTYFITYIEEGKNPPGGIGLDIALIYFQRQILREIFLGLEFVKSRQVLLLWVVAELLSESSGFNFLWTHVCTFAEAALFESFFRRFPAKLSKKYRIPNQPIKYGRCLKTMTHFHALSHHVSKWRETVLNILYNSLEVMVDGGHPTSHAYVTTP